MLLYVFLENCIVLQQGLQHRLSMSVPKRRGVLDVGEEKYRH